MEVMKIPWPSMLVQIHNKGFTWPGIGDHLKVNFAAVRNFAYQHSTCFKLTYDRCTKVLRLYEALFPEEYERDIKPILQKEIDRERQDQAIRQLISGVP